jgi:hypothetical protein
MVDKSDTTDLKITRDPTVPLNFQNQTSPNSSDVALSGGINLQAIFIKQGGIKYALINNLLVKEGEKIGNSELLTINEDSIVISENDQFKTMFLFDTNFKKASDGEPND